MNDSKDLEAISQKPTFEPSELVDHGDARELTRTGTGSNTYDGDNYS